MLLGAVNTYYYQRNAGFTAYIIQNFKKNRMDVLHAARRRAVLKLLLHKELRLIHRIHWAEHALLKRAYAPSLTAVGTYGTAAAVL
jgi:hypothetical protein